MRKKYSRTLTKFEIRKGFAGNGYILAEDGFYHGMREMAFATKDEIVWEIKDILDSWKEE